MKLTRGEEVAILLVSVIGRAHARISLSDISREHGVSLLFLKKIARSLRFAGIIKSKEGAGGGYVLAKDPSVISVLDILEAIGGKKEAISPETSRICPLTPDCIPQKIRQFISHAFSRYCSNVSIDQIVKNNARTV